MRASTGHRPPEFGGRHAVILAFLLSAVLAFSSMPVVAVTPANNAYWTYDMATSLEALGIVANLSGSVTFSFEGQRVLSFSGSEYIVNIKKVDGSLSGTIPLTGQASASASFAVQGVQYEESSSSGIIESNITLLGSVTFSSGPVSFTNNLVDTEVVLTVPSVISGFDASNANMGATWTRDVSVTRTHSIRQGQSPLNYSVSWQSANYTVQVAAATEQVYAPAGAFDAVLVTASAGVNETQQLWWSSDAGCFVKQLIFENGSSTPTLSLELTSYGIGRSGVDPLIPIAGIVMLAIAVAVLVVELMRRRRQPAKVPAKEVIPAPSSQGPGTDQIDSKR
jgi:hypothetical protein